MDLFAPKSLLYTIICLSAGTFYGVAVVGVNFGMSTLYPCSLSIGRLEVWKIGFLMGVNNLGASAACLFAGPLESMIGQKYSMIFGGVFGLSMVLSLTVMSLTAQIFSRIGIGISIGIVTSSVPGYLNANAPLKIRSALGALFSATINFTIMLTAIFAYFLLGEHRDLNTDEYRVALGVDSVEICVYRLRILFGVALVSVLIFLLLVLSPFTPNFPTVSVASPPPAPDTEENWTNSNNPPGGVNFATTLLELEQAQPPPVRRNTVKLRGNKYRHIVITIFLTFSTLGISAVMAFCSDFLKYAHVEKVTLGVVIIMTWNALSSLFAAYISTRLQRRTQMLTGSTLMFLMLFAITPLSLYFKTFVSGIIALILLGLYLTAFQCAPGSLFWIMGPQLCPESFPYFNCLHWGLAGMAAILYPRVADAIGNGALSIFGAITLICFLFFLFFLPETQGKSISEIRELIQQTPWVTFSCSSSSSNTSPAGITNTDL